MRGVGALGHGMIHSQVGARRAVALPGRELPQQPDRVLDEPSVAWLERLGQVEVSHLLALVGDLAVTDGGDPPRGREDQVAGAAAGDDVHVVTAGGQRFDFLGTEDV